MSDLIDIVLPEGQLEGTSASLATWLVKVGDAVTEGEPLAELETDKVVMEVCAAASGLVQSLTALVGDDVAPDQVLGSINTSATNVSQVIKGANAQTEEPIAATQNSPELTELSDDARLLVSPAVRRLLRENNLEIAPISGSGKGGRVTRDDVLAFMQNPATKSSETLSPVTISPATSHSISPTSASKPIASRPLKGKRVPHSKMRRSIAAHMVESLLQTSPHVTSVFEMDMSNIMAHRKWHKKEYSEQGVKLTFTAYFLAAMVKAAQAVPQTNARFHEDALELFDDINIGVGTALGDAGLVVPVVEQVQSMQLFDIAAALNAQTAKARDGKITPKDMQNGTITISNHGVSGSLFATPIIINQPEVAILGIGKLEKRVVVEEVNGQDQMVIRPKCYVSLSIDHRALDAHQTNQFLSVFVETIETWGE